jgi:hypothetical protein
MLEKVQIGTELRGALVATAHLAFHVRAEHFDPTFRANLIVEAVRIKPSHLRWARFRLGQRYQFIGGEQKVHVLLPRELGRRSVPSAT